jgi:mRNA interferase MazF
VAFERFDVVVVPFPFTEQPVKKRRPALVISGAKGFNGPAGHSVLAMITSARHSEWPLDTPIRDLGAAGLPLASMVRMKLFTLAHELVLAKAGHLAPADARAVDRALKKLFGD